MLRYTIGSVETSTTGNRHRHIAVELSHPTGWGYMASRFKGYWQGRDDWFFEQIEQYVCKEGCDATFTSNGGGNPGGSTSTSRDYFDIRSFFEAPRRKNTSSTAKDGDILGQAVTASGLDDGLNAWLQSPGPSQLSSGIGDICHASGVDLEGATQRSRVEFSECASVCDSIDTVLFGSDVHNPSESIGSSQVTTNQEIAARDSRRRCLSLSRKRNKTRPLSTPELQQNQSGKRHRRDEEVVCTEEDGGTTEVAIVEIPEADSRERSDGVCGEEAICQETSRGRVDAGRDKEDEFIARERSRITQPGRVYGTTDIPTLLLSIFGQSSLLEPTSPGCWLNQSLHSSRESVRRARLVKLFWGYNRKVAEELAYAERGQKGRCARKSGGEYRIVSKTMRMDYYMKFSTLVKIHPMMFNDGNVWEKKRDLMLPEAVPAERVISVWICGDGGVGKSRFVNWFVKYCLDHRVYKLPYSHEYKWWDGYILEKVVHIEELDLRSRMVVSQVKALLDFDTIRVEKKGSVTQPVRPWVFFITSNFTPQGVFQDEWDDALQSRFSTERYLPGGKPKEKKWSQDLVWQINSQAGFAMLFEKLKTVFEDYPGMPAVMDPNFHYTALKNPVTWVDYDHVLNL